MEILETIVGCVVFVTVVAVFVVLGIYLDAKAERKQKERDTLFEEMVATLHGIDTSLTCIANVLCSPCPTCGANLPRTDSEENDTVSL